MAALEAARDLALPDWCLAAGFVRNLVWDRLHDFSAPTPLNDLDLIYFEPAVTNAARDRELQARLGESLALPWSVKNQARMHERNHDASYRSTADAMRHWVEVETAIGARLDAKGRVVLVAPLGLEPLFAGTITLNPERPRPRAFRHRLEAKGWQQTWPRLRVAGD
ncbi:nucleotidyltransferase family protein [Halomonas almeriensis]|uniref:nucleotidyltransferase family protein n=1 Tax=Halomonas almeriensis TaxID=308163 RepID=UPI0025B5FFEB|nr:nucleotidyltransferase family protein [Halomonas almeriensis]MDN3552018.1 nucleotidyltransferase family protein [Halomonas almeriensis]